jgi:hypothetical protein
MTTELELNQVYMWNEIVERYPNLWVIITDVKEKNGEIKTCKLLNVCKSDETHILIKKYKGLGIEFECVRTTFAAPNIGVI